MHSLRLTAALVALGLLAACASASASPEASALPSVPASVAPSESGNPLPSFTSGEVPELEALIPDQVGEIVMQKLSMRGAEFLSGDSTDPAVEQFLTDLGVAPEQITLAFGFGVGPDLTDSAAIFVFRADGAGPDRLLRVYRESLDRERDTPLEWQPVTAGGKRALVAVDPGQDDRAIYLYATGDILFVVSATDPADSETVLAGLP